jgi:hypothetical protein
VVFAVAAESRFNKQGTAPDLRPINIRVDVEIGMLSLAASSVGGLPVLSDPGSP